MSRAESARLSSRHCCTVGLIHVVPSSPPFKSDCGGYKGTATFYGSHFLTQIAYLKFRKPQPPKYPRRNLLDLGSAKPTVGGNPSQEKASFLSCLVGLRADANAIYRLLCKDTEVIIRITSVYTHSSSHMVHAVMLHNLV